MSRVNRRSSPSPRWRTSSGSERRIAQASHLLVRRDVLKFTGTSDFLPDNYPERRFPVTSHRLDFLADITKRRSSFQTAASSPPRIFQPSLSSKNQKRIETSSSSKTYYKPLRDNTIGTVSPPNKFQAGLTNNKRKEYFPGMKRPSDLRDFVDFPPAKQQKRNTETRQDVSYQSKSSQLSSSNVLWCAPPCRQRTRSRERKSDSVFLHGSHVEQSCPDRDSTSSQRRALMNLKTSCQTGDGQDRLKLSKESRGQHPTSWRQFPSGNLETGLPWSGVQHNYPGGLHKKSGEGTRHHPEQKNCSESRKNIQHSKCADQSPKLQCKPRSRNEISSTQNHRYLENNDHHQRQKSSSTNNRHLQDGHRHQGTGFSSERDSCHKTKTGKPRRRQGSCERKSRGNNHLNSRNSTCSRRSSSSESFSEVDNSWPNIMPQERSRSSSLSSVKCGRSHSADDKVSNSTSDRSEGGGRSVDSPHVSSSNVKKAKVPDFNPDYVVITRRANEGAKPLCTREEFSGKQFTLVKNDEQLPFSAQDVNTSDISASSLMDLVDERQTSVRCEAEFSPAAKKSSIKTAQVIHKVEEKTQNVMNTKPVAATFHKPSRTMTNARSMLTTDSADDRVIRAQPDSVGEQGGQEQTDFASKSAEKEASFASKKSAFDLRQKIAERRQLRTGKNTSTRIVRSWPNKWKNPSQTGFHTRFQNPLSGSHATESKHSFAPWRKGPRRSVILK